MEEINNNPFRERFAENSAAFMREEISRSNLPSTEGLKLDTKFDLAQLEGFTGPSTEIKGIADKVKPVGVGDLRIDTDLGKLDESIQKIQKQKLNEKIRNWIEEAQRLIGKQQFQLAMVPLEKALATEPALAIAWFLKGYCLFGLQQYYPAIKVLDTARQHVTDPEMMVQILMLRTVCVRKDTERIEKQLAELIKKKSFDKAIALIEDELRRQPSNVALLYYKCHVLLLSGRAKQAKQAVLDAMGRVGQENAPLFQDLLTQITLEDYKSYLESARIALRRGNPAEALKQLHSCHTALAGNELYETMLSYAQEKNHCGFFASIFSRDKARLLTNASRQKLLLWLLDEELKTGSSAMSKENFDQAAESFAAAAKIDPTCWIICYLHGVAIFKGFQQVLERQDGIRDLNSIIKSLETASKLLNYALPDPIVGQQSANLLKLVNNYHLQLQNLLEIQKSIEESKTLAERGEFEEARRKIQGLPSDSKSMIEFKKNLIEQINKAQQQHKIHELIESAIEKSKKLVEDGKFEEARHVIRNLPDNPTDVIAVKQNLIGQIDKVENESKEIMQSNKQMMSQLIRKGIDPEKINVFASLNKIDVDNPYALNSLLKALCDQLF